MDEVTQAVRNMKLGEKMCQFRGCYKVYDPQTRKNRKFYQQRSRNGFQPEATYCPECAKKIYDPKTTDAYVDELRAQWSGHAFTPRSQAGMEGRQKLRRQSEGCFSESESMNTEGGIQTTFKVQPSPNKGLGVFATAPTPHAATIMLDPLVLNRKKDEGLPLVYRRFSSLASSTQEEVLKLHVHHDRRYNLNLRQTRLKDALAAMGSILGLVIQDQLDYLYTCPVSTTPASLMRKVIMTRSQAV
ncbi:MAG: hypothetical protein M1839_007784 [Geoglossum umbratile]|nr:MAG: hypothetical protein M1839_007784 [Geoglossum umbratile]